MADVPIASDLSFEVVQRRIKESGGIPKLLTAQLHQSHQHPQAIFVNRSLRELDRATPEDQFMGSRDVQTGYWGCWRDGRKGQL